MLGDPVFFRRSLNAPEIFTFLVGVGAVMFQVRVLVFQRLLSCAPFTNKDFALLANPRVTET